MEIDNGQSAEANAITHYPSALPIADFSAIADCRLNITD